MAQAKKYDVWCAEMLFYHSLELILCSYTVAFIKSIKEIVV